MAWGVLILIILGLGAVVIITLRQRGNVPDVMPVSIESQPYTEVMESISHQRTATAMLREGVSALMKSQYKVLVIDDEMDTRLLYRLQFKKDTRYAFFFAISGREALTMLNNVRPDLVIFDVKLPDIDGDELIDICLAAGKLPPCIVVTAFLSERIRQKLMTLNIPAMSKPINFIELRQAMNYLLIQELAEVS